MRNGFNIETISSVDIEEIFKVGSKVFRVIENVIYEENSKTSPLRNVFEFLYNLGLEIKHEGKNLLQ